MVLTSESKEKQVIRLRYGLEDGKTHTLEEIGEELKVTRERVRQISQHHLELMSLSSAASTV